MSKNSNVTVMKAESVKLAGSVKLELNGGKGNQVTGTSHQCAPSAVVTEENDKFAVIEVNCSCGQRISVRCNYKTA